MEASTARFLVILNDNDQNPLQRMGGLEPTIGAIGMPSIIVTSAAGKYLLSLNQSSNGHPRIQLHPASGSMGTCTHLLTNVYYNGTSYDGRSLHCSA